MTDRPQRSSAAARALGLAAALGVGSLMGALPSAHAQGWTAQAAVGQVSAEALPPEGVLGLRAGIGWTGLDASWFSLMGGVPFDEAAPYWGSLAAGTALPLGRIGAGSFSLNLAGSGYAYQARDVNLSGFGGTGEARPAVRFNVGRASVTVSAGPAAYMARDGQVAFQRAVLDSRLEAGFAPAAGLRVGGLLRHVRAQEGGYPLAAGTASLTRGPMNAWVTAGRWLATELDEVMLDAGARLGVGERVGVTVRYHIDPPDPLFWNEPRRGVSLGIDMRFGAPITPHATPHAPVRVNGEMRFQVPDAAGRDAVWIAGDFTGWERVPLTRENGVWGLTLAVPSGVHHYAFVDDRDRWFLPPGVPRIDDGMGGESGVLVVN